MYQIKETTKELVVNFSGELEHAPAKRFSFLLSGGKKLARKAAEKYVESIFDIYQQTKNLSLARNLLGEMSNDKVGIHIEDSRSKTGVVGVYLEHAYDRLGRRTPIGYVSNYTADGNRKLVRFSFKKFSSPEAAFKRAIAHRLFSINANKNWLD